MGEVVRIGRAEPARYTDGSGGPGREETLCIVERLARSDGGIRAHVGMLARALATDGRDRVVVCARADSQPRDLPAEVCQIGPWGLGRALAGADVVHAHGLRAGAAAVLMSRLTPGRRAGRRRRRARVVVTVHNRPGGSRWARAMGHALGPIVARGADQTLGVSSDLVDWLRGLGADNPERAFVPAPPLAEPVGRTSGAAPREVAGGGPLLLTVARLAPQKGLETLLDAAALLKDGIVGFDGGCDVRCSPDGEPVHFTWVIAGEGPLRGALQQRIDAEHLPVRLLGRRDDLADWYRAADLVVSTAHWEGQPVALQEAMRAGAAIVATDVGGTAETVPAALLVRDAAAAVAEGVTWALTQPGLAERLRAASLEAAAHLPTSADMVAQARRAYAGLGSGESAG
jgi:glycosyltransferase involved in cell wall biosynthesis